MEAMRSQERANGVDNSHNVPPPTNDMQYQTSFWPVLDASLFGEVYVGTLKVANIRSVAGSSALVVGVCGYGGPVDGDIDYNTGEIHLYNWGSHPGSGANHIIIQYEF